MNPKTFNPKQRATAAKAALRRPQVARWRLAGASFPEIAKSLGVATSTAYNDWVEYIRQHDLPQETIDQLRALAVQRAEYQLRKLTESMEHTADPMVRARLSDSMTRVGERLTRLLGTDSPVRLDVAAVGQVFTAEELAAAARTYLERRAQAALPPAIDLEASPGPGVGEDAGERVPSEDPAGVGE